MFIKDYAPSDEVTHLDAFAKDLLLHKQAFEMPFDTKMTGRVCIERNNAHIISQAYSNRLAYITRVQDRF